jgi:hypothetical protein
MQLLDDRQLEKLAEKGAEILIEKRPYDIFFLAKLLRL